HSCVGRAIPALRSHPTRSTAAQTWLRRQRDLQRAVRTQGLTDRWHASKSSSERTSDFPAAVGRAGETGYTFLLPLNAPFAPATIVLQHPRCSWRGRWQRGSSVWVAPRVD